MAHLFLLISWLPVGLRSRNLIRSLRSVHNSLSERTTEGKGQLRTILHHTMRPYYTSLHHLTQHTWHHITSHNTHGITSHHITSHHTSHQTILRGITPPHHTMHQTSVAESMNWVPEKDITHARVLATCSYRKYQLGCSKCRQVVVSLILPSPPHTGWRRPEGGRGR